MNPRNTYCRQAMEKVAALHWLPVVVLRMRDVKEMIPELTRHILVDGAMLDQLVCDREQVERIHRHSTRAIRLLYITTGRERCTAGENSDAKACITESGDIRFISS
jgi:hypothetical protein